MRGRLGTVERIIRLVLAGLGLWLAASLGFGTAGAWVTLAVVAILVATAAVGYCPLWALLHLTSRHGLHRVPARDAHAGV